MEALIRETLLDLKVNFHEVKMIPRIRRPRRIFGGEHCGGAGSGGAVPKRSEQGLGGTQQAVPRRIGDVWMMKLAPQVDTALELLEAAGYEEPIWSAGRSGIL